MDWLVSGAQSLPITIERKDQSEKRSIDSGTSKPTAAPTVTEEPSALPQNTTAAAVEEEGAQAAATGPVGPDSRPTQPTKGGFERTDRGFNLGTLNRGDAADSPSDAAPAAGQRAGKRSRSGSRSRAARPGVTAAPGYGLGVSVMAVGSLTLRRK